MACIVNKPQGAYPAAPSSSFTPTSTVAENIVPTSTAVNPELSAAASSAASAAAHTAGGAILSAAGRTARVLVLGASLEIAPFLELLSAAGIAVVCLDRKPQLSADFLAAHPLIKCVPQDFSDLEKVRVLLQHEHITHTLALPVGRALTTLGKINDEFGFTGPSFQAIDVMTDKGKYHEFARAHQLHDYPFVVLPDASEASLQAVQATVATQIGYPCIIKPSFGSGSDGVRLISSPTELLSYQASERFKDSPLIVEKYLSGPEYNCNMFFTADGEPHFFGVFLKEVSPAPYRQEITYLVDNVDAVTAHLLPFYRRLGKAFNLCECFLSADTIISPEGVPYIIDISPRLVGNSLIKVFLQDGINPMAIFKQDVLQQEPLNLSPHRHHLSLRFFSFAPPLTYLNPVALADVFTPEEQSHIVAFSNQLQEGQTYDGMQKGQDIARGYIMVEHETTAQADNLAKRYLDAIVAHNSKQQQ